MSLLIQQMNTDNDILYSIEDKVVKLREEKERNIQKYNEIIGDLNYIIKRCNHLPYRFNRNKWDKTKFIDKIIIWALKDIPDFPAHYFGRSQSGPYPRHSLNILTSRYKRGALLWTDISRVVYNSHRERIVVSQYRDKNYYIYYSPRTMIKASQNYKKFYNRIRRKITFKEIYESSAGIKGWEYAW